MVDEILDQAVDVTTMYTCTLFPPHRICIARVIFIADDNVDQLIFVVDLFVIVSCRQNRFSIQLNRVIDGCCYTPGSFESFDRSFDISIAYYYIGHCNIWTYTVLVVAISFRLAYPLAVARLTFYC